MGLISEITMGFCLNSSQARFLHALFAVQMLIFNVKCQFVNWLLCYPLTFLAWENCKKRGEKLLQARRACELFKWRDSNCNSSKL